MPSLNTLFWRLFLIGTILIGLVLLFIFEQDFVNTHGEENTFLLIAIFFMMGLLFAWIIGRQYINPIEKISNHLDQPIELENFYIQQQHLPKEIRHLYKSILEFSHNNQVTHQTYQADQARFNSILKNMSDGILITNEDGIISMINQSARDLFQIQEQVTHGRAMIEMLRNHHLNELLSQVISTKQQVAQSFENPLTKTYIHCIATPLEPDLPGNILFLFQDLTRIRQLEIIRRDFVSNVSHELRTPLTSLKLISETLLSGAINDKKDSIKFIGRMENEVDNLTQLVEELLELSKIESGRVPLEKQLIKPVDLIRGAVDRMALQAERASSKISYDCPKEIRKIFIDKAKLEQVLVNLIHNSIKFSSPGGEITIKAQQEYDSIVFSVSDNGIGISPKDLDRIFERFYKTDPSRTKTGTGLGLSIARHLVELHNGSIWAESQPGLGSTFYFRIPSNST